MLEKLINYWKFTKLAFVHSYFQFIFGCFLFKNVENYVRLPISSNCVAFSEWIFETRVISNQYQSINIKWSSNDEFTRNKKPLQTQVNLIWHLCPQIMCTWEFRLATGFWKNLNPYQLYRYVSMKLTSNPAKKNLHVQWILYFLYYLTHCVFLCWKKKLQNTI